MKKIYYPLLLVAIFLIFLQPASADWFQDANPPVIHVQIEQPIISHITNMDDYRACYDYYCAGKDLSSPWASKSCDNSVAYCMQAKPPGIIKPAKSNDQICSDKFGPNWKWLSGTTCGCKDGYTLENGECVIKTKQIVLDCPAPLTRINNACVDYCQYHFGDHSYSKQSATDFFTWNCFCDSGYQMNQGQTQCVKIENNITPEGNTAKTSLPAKVKPSVNSPAVIRSAVIASTTTSTTGIEQKIKIANPTAQPATTTAKKQQSQQNGFRYIANQGFFPWLFQSIRQWFGK